jgi:hypothetical protein
MMLPVVASRMNAHWRALSMTFFTVRMGLDQNAIRSASFFAGAGCSRSKCFNVASRSLQNWAHQ